MKKYLLILSLVLLLCGCGVTSKESSSSSPSGSPITTNSYKLTFLDASGVTLSWAILYYNSSEVSIRDEWYNTQNVLEETWTTHQDALGRTVTEYYNSVKNAEFEYFENTNTRIRIKTNSYEEISTCNALGKLISTIKYSPVGSSTITGYTEHEHSEFITTENIYTDTTKSVLQRVVVKHFDVQGRMVLFYDVGNSYNIYTYFDGSKIIKSIKSYSGVYPIGTLTYTQAVEKL